MKIHNLCLLLLFSFLLCATAACSKEDEELTTEKEEQTDGGDGGTADEDEVVVPPVTNLKAVETQEANKLLVTWTAPAEAYFVEVSFWMVGTPEEEARKSTGRSDESMTITVPVYGEYNLAAVAIDNYGHRSEAVRITATPAEKDFVYNWAALADSCTYVLIEQFLNKDRGTFWSTPHDVAGSSGNIYWQQAHAMDVVVYSYERIKESDPEKAATYETYFRRWFENRANNWYGNSSDDTGFLNEFTDDMCWICLTLIHLSEATGNQEYVNMARTIYDRDIITRAWTDDKGTGLPWKSNDRNRNACTNAPGCLVAAKLYRKFGDTKYLDDARMLYDFIENALMKDDGRVEEPPLTYTQGTYGEACRQLYHITGEAKYMRSAEEVILYAATSGRCLRDGILRDEGSSMDQSIFKAVYIPYAVNLTLDEDALYAVRSTLKPFLMKNAEALRANLDRSTWPAMYCDYYWGNTFPETFPDIKEASMGAQTSGASLMEGVARLVAADEEDAESVE